MPFPRIFRDRKLHGAEARFDAPDTIRVSDKFFSLHREGQRYVLSHELGHWFRQQFVPLQEIMGWTEGENFRIFDLQNSDEGFAEGFAEYFDVPGHFKDHYRSSLSV